MSGRPPGMDSARLTRAHVGPFVVFMGFLIVLMLLGYTGMEWKHPDAPWWRRNPAYVVYPIQTFVTLALLIRCWRDYAFNWSLKWCGVAVIFGSIGIGFWLLPTMLYDHWGLAGKTSGILKYLGVDARLEGFDPSIFQNSAAWWTVVLLRFLRAVVVVAFVEEIFWRGFLMRFVSDWEGDYWKQPFGRADWKSYLIVTGMFMVAHAPVDYAGAFIYGSLTYLLCVWSKSLGACVVMHAAANLLMGLYIMGTGKYGLW